jgi:hypothetical protein
MPQTNVLPDWRATYPNDAPVQKPPGVTVSTTATAPRVPNKFTYSAGTIQSYDVGSGLMTYAAPEGTPRPATETEEPKKPPPGDEPEEKEVEEEDENGDDDDDDDDDDDTSSRRTGRRAPTRTTRR